MAALLLPWAGCTQHQAPAAESPVKGPAVALPPNTFDLTCAGPSYEFTARTQDVQATLPDGYLAHEWAPGNTYLQLFDGACDIRWGNATWPAVPVAWDEVSWERAGNFSRNGRNSYTYEWFMDEAAAPAFAAWLRGMGWPVIDAAFTADLASRTISAPGLTYTVLGPTPTAIPEGMIVSGLVPFRLHHAEPTPIALSVHDAGSKVVGDTVARITANGGGIGRRGMGAEAPASQESLVFKDWQLHVEVLRSESDPDASA